MAFLELGPKNDRVDLHTLRQPAIVMQPAFGGG